MVSRPNGSSFPPSRLSSATGWHLSSHNFRSNRRAKLSQARRARVPPFPSLMPLSPPLPLPHPSIAQFQNCRHGRESSKIPAPFSHFTGIRRRTRRDGTRSPASRPDPRFSSAYLYFFSSSPFAIPRLFDFPLRIL